MYDLVDGTERDWQNDTPTSVGAGMTVSFAQGTWYGSLW